MAENPRPGLRLVERAILVGVWLISCGVVYGIGFYTGNRIQERVPATEDRVVRLPVTIQPPPEGQRPKTEDEVTFHGPLVPGHADAGRPRPKDASAGTAARQPAQPAAAPATGAAPPPGSTRARVASKAAPGAKPGTPRVAKRGTVQPAKPGAGPAAKSGAAVAAKRPSTPKRGGFTVEATATRSRSEAVAMPASLARRGFDAVVQPVPRDGATSYPL